MLDRNPPRDLQCYAVATLLGATVAAVYMSSFAGVFLFDDLVHIVNNERIRDLSSMSSILAGKRPIVDLSLAFNYAAGDLDVSGYHAVNILIHLLATLTLFGLLRRTLTLATRPHWNDRIILFLAGSTALFWAVHPLQTQSVTYVIQRGESMMALFYLLTLYCFVRGTTSARSVLWFAGSVTACSLGMGCKAVMVTAPLAVFFYDRFFVSDRWQAQLRRHMGVYIGLLATWSVLWLSGIAGGVLSSSTQGAHVGFGYKGLAPIDYLKTQAGVLVTYLKLSLWPYPLCLDYGWPIAEDLPQIMLPGVIIVAILAFALWGIVRRNAIAFIPLFFFLVLAPTSSFVPIKDTFFEHRMYLPLAAVLLGVVLAFHTILATLARSVGKPQTTSLGIRIIAVLFLALLLGATTIARNRTYASPITMWQDVSAKRPSNARAFENLGTQWMGAGDKRAAMEAYAKAVRVDPEFLSAHANLGNALLETGNASEAARHFTQVIRLDPNHIMANVNLGYALQQMGRDDDAIESFTRATRIDPSRTNAKSLANANFALGTAYARKRNYANATPAFLAAIELWPQYQKAHYTLGIVYERHGKPDEAIASYEQAIRLNPNDPKALHALQTLLTKRAGNTDS